jgi:two-component system, cell cycle sensor histidine kinase and response regulator CckA
MQSALAGLEDESLAAAVVEEFPTALLVLDFAGRVLLWNQAATRLTGWSRSEVLGQPVPFVPPEGLEGFRKRHEEAFSGGELPPLVVSRRRKDGSAMDVSIARAALRDASGKVFAVLGAVTDITERLREEAAKNQKETNFRALIERAPDAIIVYRLGIVLYTNPKMVSLLGYDRPEDLVGLRVLGLVHADDRAVAAERVRDVSEGDVEAPPFEERFLRRDGGIVDVEVMCLPVIFDGERAILSHARDITERKRFRAQLAMADRLSSVGRLAAGVGHEINNPLTYVIGSLDRLARQLREQPAASEREADLLELVSAASHGVERVRQIVRDLAVLSRGDSEERTPVDVLRVLETCVNVADHQVRNRARLVKEYEPLPTIASSESRLGQVFLNLLLNAAQAIPEGRPDVNAITIIARREGDKLVVLIRDTGVGIPPGLKDRVFDPFFTTKPLGVGTGLGLSICQSILTSLGGEIALESDGRRGTTARVTLPLNEPHADERAGATEEADALGPRRRVLVIDDEPRVAAILQTALSEAHDTQVAPGARFALDLLRRGDTFDVVLCDLMMDDMDGQAFYAAVRAEFPGLERRIAFVTGGAFTRESQDFLGSIPNPCLAKPFDLDAVFRAIRDL